MIFSKYIIHHLDLSTDLEHIQDVGYPAHYCVFWYKSIPLGEAYLFFREPITPRQFWQECIKAIKPTLRQFAFRNTTFTGQFADPEPELSGIRDLCERALGGFHPEDCEEVCDVSVVICTRNRAHYLRNCLESLRGQRSKPAEIIVVDNASLDDETRKVTEEFQVRYVREDIRGLDVARNTGARAARSSIVAYTDDDTQPDTYWVYRVSETFRDPAIAAMTGLVIAASLETEAEVIFEKFWPFNRGYVSRIFDNRFFHASLPSGPPVWEIGAGANMAFRKDIFEEVGYFDERLDVGAAGCSGDSELWYRMLACRFTIRYNPLAVVYHRHRDSIRGLRKQLYSYMRGFTVAILIQYQRFGHRGNLQHLFRVLPSWYLSLLKKGFPRYHFQYKTLFAELGGIVAGFLYYLRHRNTDSKIYSNDSF
ncbi:MAG: glycosyltransferase [Cyclobacteriaceae bacterium]